MVGLYEKLFLSGMVLLVLLSCPITEKLGGNGGGKGTDFFGNGGLENGLNEELGTGGGSLVNPAAYMLSLCPEIKTTRWRQMCEAVFSMDARKCETQRQYAMKEGCESAIAAVKKDPSLCESINPYITGIDHNGNIVDTTFKTDCYGQYAVATLDESYCGKAVSKTDCEYLIKFEKKEISLEQCKGDSVCLWRYAKYTKDKRACEQLKPGFAGADPKAECMAMITGDERYCDNIESIDSKYHCIGMARATKALESEGVFLIKECKGNSDCEMEVFDQMVKWAARN
ncbi:MAG: hypothetical protein QXD51_04260 [Candidatus Anstonellales archaeon]